MKQRHHASGHRNNSLRGTPSSPSKQQSHFYLNISPAIRSFISRKYPQYEALLPRYLEKALRNELAMEMYWVGEVDLDVANENGSFSRRRGEDEHLQLGLASYEEIERRVLREEHRFFEAQYVREQIRIGEVREQPQDRVEDQQIQQQHQQERRGTSGTGSGRRRTSIRSSASAMGLSPIHSPPYRMRSEQQPASPSTPSMRRHLEHNSSSSHAVYQTNTASTPNNALILKIIYEPMEELEIRKEFYIILPQVDEFSKEMVGGIVGELEEIADLHETRLVQLEDEIHACHKRIEQLHSINRKSNERNDDLQVQMTGLKKDLEFEHLHNRALEKRIASLEKSVSFLGTQRESPHSRHTSPYKDTVPRRTPERHTPSHAYASAARHNMSPQGTAKLNAFSGPIRSPSHARQHMKSSTRTHHSSPFNTDHSRLSQPSYTPPSRSATTRRSSPIQPYTSPTTTRISEVRTASPVHLSPAAAVRSTSHYSPSRSPTNYHHSDNPHTGPSNYHGNGHSLHRNNIRTSPHISSYSQQELYSPRSERHNSPAQQSVNYSPTKLSVVADGYIEHSRPFEFTARSPFAARQPSNGEIPQPELNDADDDHVSDTPPQSPYENGSPPLGMKPPFSSSYDKKSLDFNQDSNDEDAIKFSSVDLCSRFALESKDTTVVYARQTMESGTWGSCITADCSWTSGIHQWEMRIDSLPDYQTRNIMLGVINLKRNEFNVESQYCGETPGSYGIHFMGLECYHDNIPSSPFADQVVSITEGSVVKLTLDLDRHTLSLSVDGDNLGVGFGALPSGEYTPCVSMFHKDQRISNISYNQLK